MKKACERATAQRTTEGFGPRTAAVTLLLSASLGCGGSDSGAGGGGGQAGFLGVGGTGAGGWTAGTGGATWDGTLPPGFTRARSGGWMLGDPVPQGSTGPDAGTPIDDAGTAIDDAGAAGCGTTLRGVVRDFKDTHPDFEHYCCGSLKGIVQSALGSDLKPVYAPAGQTQFSTGPAEFDQWYRTVDTVNKPYFVSLFFVPNGNVFTFDSNSFFPLDAAGWGNQGRAHNYHFTTEVHTEFAYKGGETFRFTGDDDLFVFINRKLAIDLGGVHAALSDQIDLDARAQDLGIETGKVYPLDLFHAERHTTESNFRVDTNLQFTNCGIIVPGDIR
jgi:fibro-slime domain-containing protein